MLGASGPASKTAGRLCPQSPISGGIRPVLQAMGHITMVSEKERRGPRAASAGMGFTDEVRAHVLRRTDLPTSAPENRRQFIALDNEEREADLSGSIAKNLAW